VTGPPTRTGDLRDHDPACRRESAVNGLSASSYGSEKRLLESACRGDEDAFWLLVAPHRAWLRAHCYRMLGSPHDADDALQDALLRAWRGLCGFGGRSAFRRWLYRIATNVCLEIIARRRRRVFPSDSGTAGESDAGAAGETLTEPMQLERYADELRRPDHGDAVPEALFEQREAVELAFVAAFQHLPPRPRAVLILREVLGFSAKDVSSTLGTTVASVNSALQRARKAVADRRPDESEQARMRSTGNGCIDQFVRSFVDALERGDVNAIVAVLAKDAALAKPT
jgi:RNA polymerase sigma-70 factor (ECF subfamily)